MIFVLERSICFWKLWRTRVGLKKGLTGFDACSFAEEHQVRCSTPPEIAVHNCTNGLVRGQCGSVPKPFRILGFLGVWRKCAVERTAPAF